MRVASAITLFSTLLVYSISEVHAAASLSSCKKTTNGVTYDFTSLRNNNDNYRVSSSSQTYLINVCGDLVQTKEVIAAGCPAASSVCLVENGVAKSVGRAVENSLHTGVGTLFFKLSNPDDCNEVFIYLTPSSDSTGIGSPKFQSSTDCTHTFTWKTSASTIGSNDNTTIDSCFLKDPKSGKVFDLSSLANVEKDYEFSDPDDPETKFTMNICTPLVQSLGSECGSGTTVCEIKTDSKGTQTYRSLGTLESKAIAFVQDALTLGYHGNAKCPNSDKKTMVNIFFACDEDAGLGTPVLERSFDSCSYEVQWITSLACTTATVDDDCKFKSADGSITFDLSPLRKTSENWAVKDDKGQLYHINVCNPIVQKGDAERCPSGSSVCQIIPTPSDSSVPRQSRSLGGVIVPDVQNSELTLKFDEGEICRNKRFSSEIHFLCKEGDLGSPILAQTPTNCEYHFEWETSAACMVSKSTNAGTVVVLVLVSLGLIYVFGGVAVNRYVYKARGMEQFPNINFWRKIGTVFQCRSNRDYQIAL